MNRKSIIGDSFGRKENMYVKYVCTAKKSYKLSYDTFSIHKYYVICPYMKSVLLYGFLSGSFQEFCYKCYFHNFWVYLLEKMITCIFSDDEISSSG